MDPCKQQWNNCISNSTNSYDISKEKMDNCKQNYDKCKMGEHQRPSIQMPPNTDKNRK